VNFIEIFPSFGELHRSNCKVVDPIASIPNQPPVFSLHAGPGHVSLVGIELKRQGTHTKEPVW